MKTRTEYRTQFECLFRLDGCLVPKWNNTHHVYSEASQAKAALSELAKEKSPRNFKLGNVLTTGRVRVIERVITTVETVLAEAGETAA